MTVAGAGSSPVIVVVGSVNYDVFLLQDRLALLGETLVARGVREELGGKGANQAVQASRLGARVRFIGAVGDDERGNTCRTRLASEGVECLLAVVEQPTGLGVVNVLADGDVHATIVAGANGAVDDHLVAAQPDAFEDAACVIVQNEIPAAGSREALKRGRAAGAALIYNAAPFVPEAADLAARCDYLIVNEVEASALAGRDAAFGELASSLRTSCPNVIVTVGEQGAYLALGTQQVEHLPAAKVQPVDTTGAGDSFVGAFAVGLALGWDAVAAARAAVRVAGVATTGIGAQTQMPRHW